MSEELSILSLVLQAGPVVQLVMATLVLASVFSWVVIFQRTRVLSRAQKHARLFEDTFWSGAELVGLYKQVANSPNLISETNRFRLRRDTRAITHPADGRADAELPQTHPRNFHRSWQDYRPSR